MKLVRKTLGRVAEEAGFPTKQALVDFTGLSVNIIGDNWFDLAWTERMQGRHLQQLRQCVPEVAAYTDMLILLELQHQAKAAASFVSIDDKALRRLSEEHKVQYLSRVFALIQLLGTTPEKELVTRVTPLLGAFWQRDRGRALEDVLIPGAREGIDAEAIIPKALQLFHMLSLGRRPPGTPGPKALSRQVLAHYLTLSGDIEPSETLWREPRERSLMIDYRCGVMGALVKHDDQGLAERYSSLVHHNDQLMETELFMFPAWTGDVERRAAAPAGTPKGPLTQTGAELLFELNDPKYPSAYIYYLADTYIPAALKQDPTLGLKRADIHEALLRRLDDRKISDEAVAAIKRIDRRLAKA